MSDKNSYFNATFNTDFSEANSRLLKIVGNALNIPDDLAFKLWRL